MYRIDEQQNITMTRGDTVEIVVDIFNEDGTVYDCSGDQSLNFSVVKSYGDAPIIDQDLNLTDRTIHLYLSDTWTRDPGDYFYDVHLIQADGSIVTFISNKRLTILPEAHTWGI